MATPTWTCERAMPVAGGDATLRRYVAGEGGDRTTIDHVTGSVSVTGPLTDAALDRVDALPETFDGLDVVRDAVTDVPPAARRGFRAGTSTMSGDDEAGTVRVAVDGAAVVATLTVMDDGTVRAEEYEPALAWSRVQAASGGDLGRWQDPRPARNPGSIPDLPPGVVERYPDDGPERTTRAHVYSHDPAALDPDEREDALVVGPFPDREKRRLDRARNVLWARWPDAASLPDGVDVEPATLDLGRLPTEDAGWRLGVAFRGLVADRTPDPGDRLGETLDAVGAERSGAERRDGGGPVL